MKLKALLFATAMGLGASSASAQVVITSEGIFADCDAAWEFRNGPLVDMLNGAFAAHDADFEARLKAMIAEFAQHKAAAEAALANANSDQRKKMFTTLAKFAFFETIGGLDIDALPAAVKDGYTAAQLNVLKSVVDTSNSVKYDIGQAVATGAPPDVDLGKEGASLAISLLSKYGGPVGTFLGTFGTLSVDLLTNYWDTQPAIDVATAEIASIEKFILQQQAKSQSDKINAINMVKNQIDAECAN